MSVEMNNENNENIQNEVSNEETVKTETPTETINVEEVATTAEVKEESTPAPEAKTEEVKEVETPAAEAIVEEKVEVVAEAKEVIEEKTSAPETKVEAKVEVVLPTLSDEEKSKIEAELKEFNSSNTSFEVEIVDKTIGGYRVSYKNYILFLPISHISVRKNPSEKEIEELSKSPFEVQIQDIKELNGSTTFVVSRKKQLEAKVWDNIKVGDEVEGVVSSTPAFGVFLDLGGFEGLIHISRLAKRRINKSSDFCKKGDKLKALVIELDKENKKISLSRQEFEPSPWDGAEAKFPKDSKQTGTIKRLTNFGAYIELAPGVDGLLRNSEISWTKRFTEPSQILKVGEKIELLVKDVNEKKETLALSLKATIENPWTDLKDRYPVDSVYFAKVSQVNPKGVIFELNDEVDGFMPKSKITQIKRNAPIPYSVGESVEVKIAEIVPENESLILRPNIEEVQVERRERPEKIDAKFKKSSANSGFSLGDLLSDAVKTDLGNIG